MIDEVKTNQPTNPKRSNMGVNREVTGNNGATRAKHFDTHNKHSDGYRNLNGVKALRITSIIPGLT